MTIINGVAPISEIHAGDHIVLENVVHRVGLIVPIGPGLTGVIYEGSGYIHTYADTDNLNTAHVVIEL